MGGSHLVSLGLTCIPFESLGNTLSHCVSIESRLNSLGISWPHLESLDPLGVTGFHLVLLGLTWLHLVPLGFTWSRLVSDRSHLDPPGLA